MAFLLLAASARDDTLLSLELRRRRRVEQQQQRAKNNRHRSFEKDANGRIDNINEEVVGVDNDKDDSSHSLPWDWGSSSSPPVVGLVSSSVDNNKTHAKHPYHKSALWNSKSFASFRSYLTTKSHKNKNNDGGDHGTTTTTTTWRQRRQVRQAAKAIQSAVEERLREAPFLSRCHQLEQEEQGDDITSHHQEASGEHRHANSVTLIANDDNNDLLPPLVVSRNDINIRYWLGQGGFCEVYEIDPITEEEEGDDSSNTKVVLKHLSSTLLPQDHHHHLSSSLFPLIINHNNKVATTAAASSCSSSSSSMKSFILGAIDLRMEALYLSQLSSSLPQNHPHPNIIELRGMVQPTQGLPYGDGHYDGFGLLLEPLADTLDQKLENWKREMMTHPYMNTTHNNDDDSSSNQKHQLDGHQFRFVVSSPQVQQRLKKVLDYATQIAGALDYLHQRRIILCDVKPSNVGLSEDGTVKLFDFGLARELPPQTKEHHQQQDDDGDDDKNDRRLYTLPVAGTQLYLPPEALIQRKYNCLRDVYSFSMLLYEMISLHQPYEGLGPKEHYQRVAKDGERPPLITVVPTEKEEEEKDDDESSGKCRGVCMIPVQLHPLLQHAWDSDVTKRWTMQQVRQELENVRIDMGLLSKEQPQVIVRKQRRQHHRRKSSMDSLLNGRNCDGATYPGVVASDDDDDDEFLPPPAGKEAKQEEERKKGEEENKLSDDDDGDLERVLEDKSNTNISIASMTADDFESHFADYSHQRLSSSSPNTPTWKKAALALPIIGLMKKREGGGRGKREVIGHHYE